ncbi:MAG: metallophosphoesterase [Thermodesulforhabdaceae bacterium]|jgi:hypothetical protein
MQREYYKSYDGILFIGDPHVASFAPGHRRDEYVHTVLEKLEFSINFAVENRLLPIILGDLFHVPRNNPNALLVELIRIFKPVVPWALLGNHDKHEARFTPDVSIAVLEAADAIRLIKSYGLVDTIQVNGKKVMIGASPDWTPLPEKVDPGDSDFVIWISHHNLLFDEFDDVPDHQFRGKAFNLRSIPGVNVVVNGHLHRPRPPVRAGNTLWLNPGSLVRIIRTPSVMDLKPSVTVFSFQNGQPCFESVVVPHRSFDDVFYPFSNQSIGDEEILDGESRFIRGLENLALRRTAEGVGLRQFLKMNLNFDDPVDVEIWKLYQEVMADEEK